MKKILLAVTGAMFIISVQAQSTEKQKQTDWKKIDLSNRPNDHLMIQYGLDGWTNTADSSSPSGFSRHFNIYFMFDKPFKTNPHYSAGIGLGFASSNMFFDKKSINIKGTASTLAFTDVSATNHFAKYKLATTWLEAPIELRYAANPEHPDHGVKAAIGVKFGTLLKAYTKGKNYENVSGTSLYGKTYIMKESDKNYFNSTRVAVTGRFGFGNVSIDGSYQFTGVLKTSAGTAINAWSIGLTLSGL